MVLVEVAVLLMPEGVVIVLDLVMVPPPLVMVEDLVMPAGLLIVLDLVVLVFVVEVLRCMAPLGGVAVGGVVAAGVVWAEAAEPPSKASETRKPRMRFIRSGIMVKE